MLRLLDTYSYTAGWVMKAADWVATTVTQSWISRPTHPLAGATSHPADYPTAAPIGRTESKISTSSQNREATALLAREDHSSGVDAPAENAHRFSRQIMVPCTDFTSSIPSSSIIQGNSFSGAHHFIVNNPIMVADPTPEMERKMMKLLQKKALVDATYDSSARHASAPHCHPETRVPLRERIMTWLLNIDREEPLFWLNGPAGVGKSAIAQSLMEYCAEHRILGAGIFLSRANKRNDPNRIIPSLAHQLALVHPIYRRIITNLLSADSTVLEKRLSLQFQQLIEKPADALRSTGDSDVPSGPVLLLLDGLDECDTESAQRELVSLIASFASICKAERLPFVCVVTSRPEWQVVSAFNQLGSNLKVWREELPMDTPEARHDVEKVLHAGFARIMNKHDDAFVGDTDWPGQAKFQTIKTAASGNMLFASVVVDFIDDDDPDTQLDFCLKFLQGKLTSERNPLDPLSALYQGMLRSIPASLLRDTLLILYLQIISTVWTYFTAQETADFFHMNQQTFYTCLRKLRSVLKVPLHSEAGIYRLEFSHATFADYMKVVIQTGSFGLREAEALEDIRIRCIHWQKGNRVKEYLPGIVRRHGLYLTRDIPTTSRSFMFMLWSNLFHQGDLVKLQEELRRFPFKDLPRQRIFTDNDDGWPMRDLVENLIDYHNNNGSLLEDCVLRTTPVWPIDHELLEKCRSLIGQWGTEVQPFDPSIMAGHELYLLLCSADDPFDDSDAACIVARIRWCPRLAYMLLGHGQNTILAIVWPMAIERGAYWQETFERTKNVHASASTLDTINLEHALHLFDSQLSKCMHHSEDDKWAPVVRSSSFECILVSFITDAQRSTVTQLKVVTDILSNVRDPLEIIHLLCQHTLHDIPCEIKLAAQRILAFLVGWWGTWHSKDVEQLLHLDHAVISRAIQWLHPFIFSWSPPSEPDTIYLEIQIPYSDLQGQQIDAEVHWKQLGYHPYFRFEEQIWMELFALLAQFGNSRLRTSHLIFPHSGVNEWGFLNHASRVLCSIHTNKRLVTAATELHNFPFCHSKLQGTDPWRDLDAHYYILGLKMLVCQLSMLVSVIGPIIRNQPICDVDHLLLEKWVKMGHDFEFAKFPLNERIQDGTIFHVVSLQASTVMPSVQQVYRIFLIGEGCNSCLIVMRPRSTWDDVDKGYDRNATLNENEMLDEENDSENSDGPWSWSMAPVETLR